jgi:hypothetical protein
MKLGERKIMKFFKKALVATAVVSAFGAQAVTVSSSLTKISEEGLAAGNTAVVASTGGKIFVLDFVVDKLTPAASTISLTFSKGVELDNVATLSENVNNVVGTGVGIIDIDTAGGGGATNSFFSYGTGSFTFDKFNVDTDNTDDKHVLSFDVNLGNPLTASSAFRLTLDDVDTNGFDLGDTSAEVCYKSVDANDVLIEEGCSPISEVVSQFDFTVEQKWDGKIERIDQTDFSRQYDGADSDNDTVKFKLGNDESLVAALLLADANITFDADFTGVVDGDLVDANFGANPLTNAPTINVGEDEISFQVPNADFATEGANAGTSVSGYVTFNAGVTPAVIIPQTGLIVATADFNVGTDSTTIIRAAGQWMLDATVINVPYLPVGYADAGTFATVEIANDGTESANVMATFIMNGVVDGVDALRSESFDLGDVPANTVVKYSAAALATAFGIEGSAKLSVTFNIDAYAQDISAYATVQSGTGRSEVSNSQTKVDGKGL